MRFRIEFGGQHFDMIGWNKIGDLHAIGDYLDPIAAVHLLEHARESEGAFIWAKDLEGTVHALYAGAITEGWIVHV